MTQQASSGSGIRPMEARDVPVVAEIEYESFPCPWPEEQFRECLKYPVFRCLVAIHNNHIAGYTIALYEAEAVHILDLATAVEVRRQGFARLLLRRLIADAARQGLRSAYLEVRTRNLRARALYESEGFTQAEFLPNHYPTPPDDGLRLARSIG
ncbi:MAG TPA: ribosomal protein S18-alanine N-acetyltransferase [Candidatus Ozemobacteraceae bacterium]|nr:ribosomal protein S18-alanine N-acetyltransferase [Candidatus Ozemobacteraceae bacterium]